ncbi:hypothetical protein CI610_02852 [invertebrate metagenome]|uniref:Uncharacterized protein n=1 Tax=invertebrate metagenome TaxID=1711999 RepID=A0A2H9T4T3_9ZZZZ
MLKSDHLSYKANKTIVSVSRSGHSDIRDVYWVATSYREIFVVFRQFFKKEFLE